MTVKNSIVSVYQYEMFSYSFVRDGPVLLYLEKFF